MLAYAVKRIGLGLLILVFVMVVMYAAVFLVPGDPATVALGPRATPELKKLLIERMGLDPERAAAAFHAYASYTIGATLFAATRRIANDQLAEAGRQSERYHSEPDLFMARQSRVATRDAIDEVVDVSTIDPDRDEQLFVTDLRALIASFGPMTRAAAR